MKNSFIIICLLVISNFNPVLSEELKLNSNSIKLDKNNNSVTLNGNVNVSDNFGIPFLQIRLYIIRIQKH